MLGAARTVQDLGVAYNDQAFVTTACYTSKRGTLQATSCRLNDIAAPRIAHTWHLPSKIKPTSKLGYI